MTWLTKQEIFDKVSQHLLDQKARSADGNRCMYRGPNGLKCALGCLIKDEFYDPVCEVSALLPNTALVNAMVYSGVDIHAYMDLLLDLQNVHDNAKPDAVSNWGMDLLHVACKHSLNAEVLG